jgi:hypothetical protein
MVGLRNGYEGENNGVSYDASCFEDACHNRRVYEGNPRWRNGVAVKGSVGNVVARRYDTYVPIVHGTPATEMQSFIMTVFPSNNP